jgi:hypothetical protein
VAIARRTSHAREGWVGTGRSALWIEQVEDVPGIGNQGPASDRRMSVDDRYWQADA